MLQFWNTYNGIFLHRRPARYIFHVREGSIERYQIYVFSIARHMVTRSPWTDNCDSTHSWPHLTQTPASSFISWKVENDIGGKDRGGGRWWWNFRLICFCCASGNILYIWIGLSSEEECCLKEAGFQVVLLEARQRLGGLNLYCTGWTLNINVDQYG